MAIQHDASYLKEVLAGEYSNYSEDRLSQICCASFNHSRLFRKVFLDTINLDSKSISELKAETQIGYGLAKEDARIDIIIYKNSKPFIVIENKVDAPLTSWQLEKYDKIRDFDRCKKVVIVKHYFDSIIRSQWKIYHWADLCSAFTKAVSAGINDPIENFVLSNFVEHLELMNMSRVNRISKSELVRFSEAIYKLRNKNPYMSLTKRNIFETGNQLLSVLEEIIDLVRQEQIITKSIGRNFRFTPNINSWWLEERTENNLSITVGISVPKTKNKVKYLGTGFFFYANKPEKYDIKTYAQSTPRGGGEFIEETHYPKRDLLTDHYAEEVISTWKKWIAAK